MVIKKNRKGFTLIELLVVIAIIGLLSTLAVVALGNAQARARDSKRAADIKQIQTALALFYSTNNRYPPTNGTDGEEAVLSTLALLPAEMPSVPAAPAPADGTCTDDAVMATTQRYYYNATAGSGANPAFDCFSATSCGSYELQFCLGAAVGGGALPGGMHCAGPNSTTGAACVFTD